MTSIGSYEAKVHLAELLDRVAAGEEILITRRGKPAALLTLPPATQPDVEKLVRQMLGYRDERKITSGKARLKDLVEEGRWNTTWRRG